MLHELKPGKQPVEAIGKGNCGDTEIYRIVSHPIDYDEKNCVDIKNLVATGNQFIIIILKRLLFGIQHFFANEI